MAFLEKTHLVFLIIIIILFISIGTENITFMGNILNVH